MRTITFEQHIARLERRCRGDIADAMIETASRDDIDGAAIEAALRANGSSDFKPDLQGQACRAAGILEAIESVRSAIRDEDAELVAVRAVSLGCIAAEAARELFIELTRFEDSAD